MEQEKMTTIGTTKSFASRFRLIAVTVVGIFALHLGWWRLVEIYVPPEERPKRFEFLGKVNSLILREKKEEEKT